MKVLLLSPYSEYLEFALLKAGDSFVECTGKPEQWPTDCDFIVSFGYRHTIPKLYIDRYQDRLINIHCSYLPYNKGADPNFWSWFDDTPKGVSIHEIDEGLDTGDILMQRICKAWLKEETLKSSWLRLMGEGAILFNQCWPMIRKGQLSGSAQLDRGTYHKKSDKEQWFTLLPDRWDTSVEYVARMGERQRFHD